MYDNIKPNILTSTDIRLMRGNRVVKVGTFSEEFGLDLYEDLDNYLKGKPMSNPDKVAQIVSAHDFNRVQLAETTYEEMLISGIGLAAEEIGSEVLFDTQEEA